MKKTLQAIHCKWCGNAINDDSSWSTKEGERLCWECYREEYEKVCCVCDEYYFVPEKGHISDVFAVIDGDEAGVETGLYEVLRRPFYAGSIIGGGWFFEDSIRRLGSLPEGADEARREERYRAKREKQTQEAYR